MKKTILAIVLASFLGLGVVEAAVALNSTQQIEHKDKTKDKKLKKEKRKEKKKEKKKCTPKQKRKCSHTCAGKTSA